MIRELAATQFWTISSLKKSRPASHCEKEVHIWLNSPDQKLNGTLNGTALKPSSVVT